MKYWMMQLFLTSRAEGTIFEGLEKRESRQEYLQRAFSQEVGFLHRQKKYVYEPFESPRLGFVIGAIGREFTVTTSGPPEEKFAPKEVDGWQTANVFIDTSGDEDGQRVAMHQESDVGQPVAVFRSLVEHINRSSAAAEWSISVNAITKRDQFWVAADKHKGQIQELDLTFVTPNIWGGTSETEKALKALKGENNAEEVEVRLRNKDASLEPDSATVRKSVDYIERGGGSVRLKGAGGTLIYSSEQEENVETISPEPDERIQTADVGMLRSLIERIFR